MRHKTEYAFGVSELLLHRLKEWPTKGPLTPMAKRELLASAYVSAFHQLTDTYLVRRLFLAIELALAL